MLREADERAYRAAGDAPRQDGALVEALLQREELLRDEIEQVLGGLKQKPPESPNGAVEVAPREPERAPRTVPAV